MIIGNELPADLQCLRNPGRSGLNGKLQRNPPLTSVPQQPAVSGQIVVRTNQQVLANACQHQRRQRIVDHRLVKNRQQLFADMERCGMQSTTNAAAQDNPFLKVMGGSHGTGSRKEKSIHGSAPRRCTTLRQLNHRARFCDMCRCRNSKSESRNPKQTRMTETQMTPTGGSSTRGSSEENDDGRFEHSDIRILNLLRIADFVLRICCSPRRKSRSVI